MLQMSYYGKYKKPNGISTSFNPPKIFKGEEYLDLKPNSVIWYNYLNTHDEVTFKKDYLKQLSKLDPHKVYKDLDGKVILSYEEFGKFSTRSVIAQWLSKYGYIVNEYYSYEKKYFKGTHKTVYSKETNIATSITICQNVLNSNDNICFTYNFDVSNLIIPKGMTESSYIAYLGFEKFCNSINTDDNRQYKIILDLICIGSINTGYGYSPKFSMIDKLRKKAESNKKNRMATIKKLESAISKYSLFMKLKDTNEIYDKLVIHVKTPKKELINDLAYCYNKTNSHIEYLLSNLIKPDISI